MSRISWKWYVLIVGVFIFEFYWAITSHQYMEMRQVSLGQPDLMFFVILGTGLLFAGWFSGITVLQNLSTEIATETGGICVHSMDPVAVIDPLERENLHLKPKKLISLEKLRKDKNLLIDEIQKMVSEPVNMKVVESFHKEGNVIDLEKYVIDEYVSEWKLKLRNSKKYKHYISDEEIHKIRESHTPTWEKDGYEISKYLESYKESIDGMKPIGLWADGGVKALGWQGLKWYIGGTSLLACPEDLVIPHGDGGVAIVANKDYTDLKQLMELPNWLQRGIIQAFPQFIPGKHIVSFGNRPHPKAVRARVERNVDAADYELDERPKWIWTLGLQVKEIDPVQRAKLLEEEGDALSEEADVNQDNLAKWEKRYLAKMRGIPEPNKEDADNEQGE